MGREIKFRVWDEKRKAMEKCINLNPFHVTDCDRRLWQWDEVEVMQYIGLKDRNGREIYEGDILAAPHYPFQDEGRHNYHGVIEWIDEEASFYMTKRLANKEKRGISDGISQPIERIEEFEVIGNIYENPGLLVIRLNN